MDARKRRSRLAIEQAFSELLLERDYAKITVADILARSGVGRATFYAQFKGKDDLLAELVSGLCTCALRVDDGSDLGPEQQLEQVLQNLWERREGVKALVKGAGSRRFADCLRHSLSRRADGARWAHGAGRSDEPELPSAPHRGHLRGHGPVVGLERLCVHAPGAVGGLSPRHQAAV